MKIYLIERTDRIGYDEYDSIIVIAKDEAEALEYQPSGDKEFSDYSDSWTNTVDNIIVTLIGTATRGSKSGVVLASFNAG